VLNANKAYFAQKISGKVLVFGRLLERSTSKVLASEMLLMHIIITHAM
jgi:hypothetical protein